MTKRYGLTLRFRGSHSLSLFSGGVCVITRTQIALHPKTTKLVQVARRKNRLTYNCLVPQLSFLCQGAVLAGLSATGFSREWPINSN